MDHRSKNPLYRIETIKLPYENGQLSLICRSDFLHPLLPQALIAIRSECGKSPFASKRKSSHKFPHLGE